MYLFTCKGWHFQKSFDPRATGSITHVQIPLRSKPQNSPSFSNTRAAHSEPNNYYTGRFAWPQTACLWY